MDSTLEVFISMLYFHIQVYVGRIISKASEQYLEVTESGLNGKGNSQGGCTTTICMCNSGRNTVFYACNFAENAFSV